MSEKYLNLSPHACCMGNPIKFVDPDGKDIWELDSLSIIKKMSRLHFYMPTKQKIPYSVRSRKEDF